MKSSLITLVTALAALTSLQAQQRPIAQRGFFYVGGHYTRTSDSEVMTGQMYVESNERY
jgi:hypothetical protein